MGEIIGLIAISCLFCSLTLVGLIGSIRKDFIFVRGYSRAIHYREGKARSWGVIFFIAFSMPTIVFTSQVINKIKGVNSVFIIIGILIVSCLLMIVEQKMWRRICVGKTR